MTQLLNQINNRVLIAFNKVLKFPSFEKEEETLKAKFIIILTYVLIFPVVIILLVNLAIGNVDTFMVIVISSFILIQVFVQILARIKKLKLASVVFPLFLWIQVMIGIYLRGGIENPIYYFSLIPILIAGLLLGLRGSIVFASMSIIAGGVLLYITRNGIYSPRFPSPHSDINQFLAVLTIIIFVTSFHYLTILFNQTKDQKLAIRSRQYHKASEELKASQQLFYDLHEKLLKAESIASMGFLDWNLKNDEVYLSNQVIKMCKLNPSLNWVTADLVTHIIHPDDIEYVAKNLEMAQTNEKPYDIDHRIKISDNESIWVHAQAELILDEFGKPDRLLGTIIDITERKKIEVLLGESEEKYRSIINSSLDGIITINRLGEITHINEAATTLFGYNKGELLKKYVTVIIPSRLRDKHSKSIGKYLSASERPFGGKRIELIGLSKNGKEIDISLSVSELLINGELHFTGIISDIRERKIAEKLILSQSTDLERMNRVLNSILASNTAIKIASDERSLLENICEIIVKKGGYKLAWIGYGQNDKTVKIMSSASGQHDYLKKLETRWDDSPQSQSPAGRAISIGKTIISKNRMVDNFVPWIPQPTDPSVFASISLPLKLESATIGSLNVYSTVLNVFNENEVKFLEELAENVSFGIKSLRIKADKTAIQSKFEKREGEILKLATAVEQSPSITIITDVLGNIEYTNPKFTEITGYSVGEVIGKNPRFLKSGYTAPEEYTNLWRTITSGDDWHGILKNQKKNGEFYWASVAISPVIDTMGTIINFIAVQKDITNEKIAEEQALQSQKMEAIGRLSGGIAHDFNNILTGISLSTDILDIKLPKDDPLRVTVEELKKGYKLANSITQQLITFSKKQQTILKTFQPAEILKNLRIWINRLVGKSIQINLEIPSQHLEIRGDPSKLEQILVNLIVNSKDAMDKGGTIDLSMQEVVLDDNFNIFNIQHIRINEELGTFFSSKNVEEGKYLLLEVKDTGSGIEEKTFSYIFEPFFSTKEPGEGTGLGLSTVYGIIRDWNGFISVTSQLEVGTEFHIFLPLVGNS